MPALLFLAIAAWFLLGDPAKTTAGWIYPDRAAPWEPVDAFYYPSRYDLSRHQVQRDVDGVEACRSWAYSLAAGRGDPGMTRGTYECGVGKAEVRGGLNVYRLTIQ